MWITAAATMAIILGVAASAGASPGLVAHWRFDEGTGLTAADSSGSAQTGALLGPPAWITGRRGGALRFGGSDRVAIEATAALAPSRVTVEAWVRSAGSPGASRYIVAKGATGCIAASYALYTGPDGGLRFYVSSGAGTDYVRSADAGSAVWDGNWHHVAGTFDGGAVRLYVDGQEAGAATPAAMVIDYAALDTRDLLVGAYAGCGGLNFTGDIDEVKVWSRALGADELDASAGYRFRGFFAPVDNLPGVNVVQAGRAIPVTFGLTGFQGLDILATGSPASRAIACDREALFDPIERTVTAGASTLSYDAATDRYSYVWKTAKSWAGTCRQLVVRLDDGSAHTAAFRFKK